jgi:lipopolysaccharide/colanic/teichoic acid biosynthesis glycosyltransferase
MIIKRVVDIILSLIIIILTLPVQLIIAVVLILIFKENPLFIQSRGLTLEKFRFTIIKFKTIHSKQALLNHNPRTKDIFLLPELSGGLKPFARFLRKTGLDELPQIYNVLLGQMSFVGPRPLMINDLEIMKNEFLHYYELRNSINSKPGITGVWQIIGDRSLGAENLIGLDIFYDENKSLLLDFKIFLTTIPLIIFAKNSDAFAPRIDFISSLFSLSFGMFAINYHNEFISEILSQEKKKTYTLKIPLNWWFISDSYNSVSNVVKTVYMIGPIEKNENYHPIKELKENTGK